MRASASGISRRQQQVDARADRGEDVEHLGRSLGQRRHVERVGDRHPLEAQVAPQQVGHHGPRQRAGQVVATGHGRHRRVPRHREPGASRERGSERHELAGIQHVPRRLDHRQTVVRVGRDVPHPRGVLDRGGHPGRLQPADHRGPVPPDGRRRVPERPDPERRVGGVRGQIQDGGVDDVHAHRSSLAADREADALRERGIVHGAQSHVAGEGCRAVTERQELAALLVGRDEHRRGTGYGGGMGGRGVGDRRARPLEGGGQLQDLPRRPNVVRSKERHPGGRRRGQPGGDPGRQHLPLEREHNAPQDRVAAPPAHHVTPSPPPPTRERSSAARR